MIGPRVRFDTLCLGARFRYTHDGKAWVKIGHNEIAEWDYSKVADTWVGQLICCFNDADDYDLTQLIYLVEEDVQGS